MDNTQQPDIQLITAAPLTNPDGSSRIIVIGLGADNLIYNWQWSTGNWKLDAKGAQAANRPARDEGAF